MINLKKKSVKGKRREERKKRKRSKRKMKLASVKGGKKSQKRKSVKEEEDLCQCTLDRCVKWGRTFSSILGLYCMTCVSSVEGNLLI